MVSVAIIGAGPAGLASARVLIANGDSYQIDMFESHEQIGGVWYYTKDGANHKSDSSMYEQLETNLCSELMSFEGLAFSADTPLFPRREQVFQYLVRYYDEFVKPFSNARLFLNKRVVSLTKSGSQWEIMVADEEVAHRYDYVLVANGHFTKPSIPKVTGIQQWGNQIHSKDYDRAEDFAGKRVIVVGNGSSAIDITNQVASTAARVYQSVRADSSPSWPEESAITVIPEIQELISTDCSVRLVDGSTVENVDCVIWATGFLYDVPFLKTYQDEIFDDNRTRLFHLWEHLVYKGDPTLFFPLLLKNVVPFSLAELQACVIDLVIREIIPKAEIVASVDDNNRDEPNSDYHSLPTPKDVQYYRKLQAIINTHPTKTEPPFKPRVWTEYWASMRAQCSTLKADRNAQLTLLSNELRKQGKAYHLP